MKDVSITLTKKHCAELLGCGMCNLEPRHLNGKKHIIKLANAKAGGMLKAQKAKVPMQLIMSRREIEASGIKEFFQKIKSGVKKGAEFYKKNLKSTLGPIIKKGVEYGLNALETAAAVAQPQLIPGIAVVKSQNSKIVDKLGSLTGAYGLHSIFVQLSKAQASKLLKPGKTVQLKPNDLHGAHEIMVDSKIYKKYNAAKRLNKGVRISYASHDEITGGSLRSILAELKKQAPRAIALAKPIIGPKVKKMVEEKTHQAFSALAKKYPKLKDEIKQAEAIAAPYVSAQVGKRSGLFGKGIQHSSLKGPPATAAEPVGRGLSDPVVYGTQRGPMATLPRPIGA